ncbi:unnamed protein product [Meganyctiphanes norvegica]|uniref:Uncharacterized protein n=1 Tax=Meganyctiphanes norvegica TaxID=48144 RepID=A0AAV2QKY8_MEGNR
MGIYDHRKISIKLQWKSEPCARGHSVGLVTACHRGDEATVKRLLQEGANTEERLQDGRRCLHIACQMGSTYMVRSLLEAGANPDIQDSDGRTPLLLALENGTREVVEDLLASNADVMLADNIGVAPVHEAVRSGSIDLVKKLMEYKQLDVNICDSLGNSPAHYAAYTGYIDILELLFDVSARADLCNIRGQAPIHMAVFSGDLAVVQSLACHGVDLECEDQLGITPIQLSYTKAYTEIAVWIHNFINIRNKVIEVIGNGDEDELRIKLDALVVATAGVTFPILLPGSQLGCPRGTLIGTAASQGKHQVLGCLSVLDIDINHRGARGCTPLHDAARAGHVLTVCQLLDQGADIDANSHMEGEKGQTALQIAAYHGYTEVVTELCQRGADVNNLSQTNCSALYYAVDQGHLKSAKKLLKNKANHDIGLPSILPAVNRGDIQIVKAFLKAGLNFQSSSGKESMLKASQKGQKAILEHLIGSGCEIGVFDEDGRSCLHLAASGGHLNIVQWLMEEHNADPCVQDNLGLTPAQLAALRGNHHVSNWINKLAEQDSQENLHGLSLGQAQQSKNLGSGVMSGNQEAVLEALMRGADPNHTIDTGQGMKDTVLRVSIIKGYFPIVAILLEGGTHPEAKGDYPIPPLIEAICRGHTRIAESLLKAGSNVEAIDNEGNGALHLAVLQGDQPLVKMLLHAGALTCTVTKNGLSVIHLAIQKNDVDIIRILIEAGADINSSKYDEKPLASAVHTDCQNTVETVLRLGANVNIRDAKGMTALHLASQHGCSNVIASLLSAGANLTARTNDGLTSLHVAARYAQFEVFKILVEEGHPVNVLDTNGLTSEDIALEGNSFNIVNWLRKSD